MMFLGGLASAVQVTHSSFVVHAMNLLRNALPANKTHNAASARPQRRNLFKPCAGCVTGSLDAGHPKGSEVTLAGFPCYLSKPDKPNGHAIIVATDIFGHTLINTRLIADALADNGYLCAVPDYFESDPMDAKMLELFESLPSRSWLGKLSAYAQLAGHVMGMAVWIRRHPMTHAEQVVSAVAAALKAEHGVDKVGVQGYCYGGKVGVLLAAQPELVDAVAVAHPSALKVPDDLKAVQVPLLFLCASTDAQFPEATRTQAMQTLEELSPGLATFILYPGTNHGFATRGSKADPAVNAACADALQRGIQFFNRHLCGVRPPQEPLNAAATPVGIRLALAPRAC